MKQETGQIHYQHQVGLDNRGDNLVLGISPSLKQIQGLPKKGSITFYYV